MKWDFDFLNKYQQSLDWDILSKNSSIIWTNRIIEKFEDKLNFWSLSLYGNLSFEIIETFATRWTVTDVLSTKWVKFSDFGSECNEEITSGWDNLSFNPNIIWTDPSVRYFFDKINWYYFATKGLFKLSNETIKNLPQTGKRFSPEHSMCFRRGDYELESLTEYYSKRNIKS